jgi:hypothetical protein
MNLFSADRCFPESCPPVFRDQIRPGMGRFSMDGLRHLYHAANYFEVELKDGSYWQPPFGEDDFEPQFIVASGDSGRGKTRAAWAVLGGGCKGEVPTVEYVRAVDFASEIPARAKRNDLAGDEYSLSDYLNNLASKHTDFLFLDDLGQCPLKGRVAVELWNLVDRIYQAGIHDAPRVIITTNARRGGTLFEAVDSEDAFRVKAMLRRIRESCYLVDFDRGEGFVVRAGQTVKVKLPERSDLSSNDEWYQAPEVTHEQ